MRTFGTLEFSWYSRTPETYMLEEQARKHYGEKVSKVSQISSEDLAWMLEGFMQSFNASKEEYGILIIPLIISDTGLRIVIDTGINIGDSLSKVSFMTDKMVNLLGLPTAIIHIEGRVVFEWSRNMVCWF